ncbi:MAG: hypothetical protein JSS62_04555 [Verrucomicrobia bacterium]|nr:hypothetical protein [Verrucomicrobiota bacterium]MBS0647048.1 hypothetical protein [Verrucomicrobiota bacterium]
MTLRLSEGTTSVQFFWQGNCGYTNRENNSHWMVVKLCVWMPGFIGHLEASIQNEISNRIRRPLAFSAEPMCAKHNLFYTAFIGDPSKFSMISVCVNLCRRLSNKMKEESSVYLALPLNSEILEGCSYLFRVSNISGQLTLTCRSEEEERRHASIPHSFKELSRLVHSLKTANVVSSAQAIADPESSISVKWAEEYSWDEMDALIQEGLDEEPRDFTTLEILNLSQSIRLKSDEVGFVKRMMKTHDVHFVLSYAASILDHELKYLAYFTIAQLCLDAQLFIESRRALSYIPEDVQQENGYKLDGPVEMLLSNQEVTYPQICFADLVAEFRRELEIGGKVLVHYNCMVSWKHLFSLSQLAELLAESQHYGEQDQVDIMSCLLALNVAKILTEIREYIQFEEEKAQEARDQQLLAYLS